MPFQITAAGLQIQSLDEINSEIAAEFRTAFGNAFKTGQGSVAGKLIGSLAEREATLQQLAQALIQILDPNNATGAFLEIVASITNSERKDASYSESGSFLATGVAATVINTGRQFKNVQSGELWDIVDGPYVIGGGGTIAVTARAHETGPASFVTSGPGDWSITLGVVGWTTIEATADIDPEDTGSDIETDADFRDRRVLELDLRGNDIDATRAIVGVVIGVKSVYVTENQSCSVALDGIPPGAFEAVVDGGDDIAIAEAIYSVKPPGAQAYGSTIVNVTDSEGGLVPIGFTRPTDVDFWILITCSTVGAEGALPVNAEQVVLDAALAYGNAAFNTAGFDVVPQAFIGTIFAALRDAKGKDSITGCTVLLSLDNGPGTAPAYPLTFPPPGAGVDPYTAGVRVITLRDRADFDSARIGVTIT